MSSSVIIIPQPHIKTGLVNAWAHYAEITPGDIIHAILIPAPKTNRSPHKTRSATYFYFFFIVIRRQHPFFSSPVIVLSCLSNKTASVDKYIDREFFIAQNVVVIGNNFHHCPFDSIKKRTQSGCLATVFLKIKIGGNIYT